MARPMLHAYLASLVHAMPNAEPVQPDRPGLRTVDRLLHTVQLDVEAATCQIAVVDLSYPTLEVPRLHRISRCVPSSSSASPVRSRSPRRGSLDGTWSPRAPTTCSSASTSDIVEELLRVMLGSQHCTAASAPSVTHVGDVPAQQGQCGRGEPSLESAAGGVNKTACTWRAVYGEDFDSAYLAGGLHQLKLDSVESLMYTTVLS